MRQYFAHSGMRADKSDWQELRIHLRAVAQMAASFAREALPARDDFIQAAKWTGLLHDLGKYRDGFQQRILFNNQSGEPTWHKQAGAALAADQQRLDIAFAIAGHHGGLPDFTDLKRMRNSPSGMTAVEQIWTEAQIDCPELSQKLPFFIPTGALEMEWYTRVLFSCLVDADWSDTAAHQRQVRGVSPEPQAERLDAKKSLSSVMSYIQQRATRPGLQPGMVQLRQQVLDAALSSAQLAPGLFSMTVPTGGAKTLAALAFALQHAAIFGQRHVIYVAPYLTIIEQNAEVIRAAVGADREQTWDRVFEHHSLREWEEEQPPSEKRLSDAENETSDQDASRRAENWSSPFVVTTTVQFFESLFSNKPGACRKLHRIAQSVVILDECQTLPPGLIAPTCGMLGQWARLANCSIVLATATLPAWKQRPNFPAGLENVREMMPVELNLFRRLRRVQVAYPQQDDKWAWQEVADRMAAEKQILCVVNTKKAARTVFQAMRGLLGTKGLFHLSTSMCPQHRLQVIEQVRHRLAQGKTCRLVSTQLIQAGVDLDFPVVLRELAPLEDIIQSAGRCNREGKLNKPDGSPGGRVVVFRSTEGTLPPDHWYRAGTNTVEQLLNDGSVPDIGEPADMESYFLRLYQKGNLDVKGIHDKRIKAPSFQTIARDYRLIDSPTEAVVIATWKSHQDHVEQLLSQIRIAPSRRLFARLGRFQVNLFPHEWNQLASLIAEESNGLKIWHGPYDSELGLCPDQEEVCLLV